MGRYQVRGGRKLSGSIKTDGSKNAVLPVLAAAVATGGESIIENCPAISDVDSMISILEALGCRICRDGTDISVDAAGISDCSIPDGLMKEMRSSVFLAGALAARYGEAVITSPGGCRIGSRPIDIHLEGLRKLGAVIHSEDGRIHIEAADLKGTDIMLPYPSVGATENLMMAALGAEGVTTIRNSAREPEIADLQGYINCCGGRVTGAGTGIIRIEGRHRLTGIRYRISEDRIEAGTYILMALGTGGDIFLEDVPERNLGILTDILQQAGVDVMFCDGGVRVRQGLFSGICTDIDTSPFPGFPTDLQPQMVAFLAGCGKGSRIRENIFENRLGYAGQLRKMGADIEILRKEVIIKDNSLLHGATVEAEDLRGGAALVSAALMAEGTTDILNTGYIRRGYSRLVLKVKKLGGEIEEYEKEKKNCNKEKKT